MATIMAFGAVGAGRHGSVADAGLRLRRHTCMRNRVARSPAGHNRAVQAQPPTNRPISGLLRRASPVWISIGIIAVFLATRLPVLDADVPEWALSQYSPIDEFGYTIPAFNLYHYGTWVHQATPFTSIEGWPMNAAQNVVAAATMRLVGYDFWGFRASSVLFGLLSFLALLAIVKREGEDAVRLDRASTRLAQAVTLAAGVLLLADFSSLISARIVEPTVTRLAAASVIVWLVGRGTFLGSRQGLGRSVIFGAAVTASVLFVYVYNAFLVPAAFVALIWWAVQHGGRRVVGRHALAFVGGCLVIAIVYFGLVYVTYSYTPVDWYRAWIGSFSASNRFTGISIDKALSILDANVFRLDPAFLVVCLASLPLFAWTLARRPTALAVLVGAGLAIFVAQSAYIADYPHRKFLMIMLFTVPIVTSAILGWSDFRTWVLTDRRRLIATAAWFVGAIFVTAQTTPLGRIPSSEALLGRIVIVAGVVGITAIVGLVSCLLTSRRTLALIATGALGIAILAPLLYADARFVYRHPTFTYRDATIAVGGTIDGQVTAGSLSTAMQLNNTSRSVVSPYFYQSSLADYEAAVVRVFRSGLATSLFSYVDTDTRTHLESLGFRLVDTYEIILPLGKKLGRYVYGSTGALGRAVP
jgi:hypothetical protein